MAQNIPLYTQLLWKFVSSLDLVEQCSRRVAQKVGQEVQSTTVRHGQNNMGNGG
jgi:hypothetical protein